MDRKGANNTECISSDVRFEEHNRSYVIRSQSPHIIVQPHIPEEQFYKNIALVNQAQYAIVDFERQPGGCPYYRDDQVSYARLNGSGWYRWI